LISEVIHFIFIDKPSGPWHDTAVIEIRVPRRRHFGPIMAAVIAVAAVVAAAPASALAPGPTLITSPNSKNVTGKDGRVPSTHGIAKVI
jgi:hypothetical protein